MSWCFITASRSLQGVLATWSRTRGSLRAIWGPASMRDEALLSIDGLCVAYDGSTALNGVSLRIHKGELICVVGANGAGKTSLIRSISGIVPSSTGVVKMNGVDITGMPPWDICERGIAQ